MKAIEIGADHAGFELKQWIINKLQKQGWLVNDHGTHGLESVDYPDFAHPTAEAVIENKALGILICGSANGVCISANKHADVRAALCWNKEVAVLARSHNDANIIGIPARFVTTDEAWEMVEAFLETPFEGGRHQKRVEKIKYSI
jgi:ribose 5-phosphate isomerase B